MMPGAGLYLPDTLSKTIDCTAPRTVKPKYFGRKTSQDSDMDRQSIALSRKSSEDITSIFSALPTVFDFADWAAAQGKASSDNEVFVSNLQRVRRDVTEASRLYASHAVTEYLESWPDKKTWIDDIIRDIERALNDIGLFIETVRVSGDDGGTVGLRRKFQWALSHQKKLMSKQNRLMICHQSLMSAVQLMQAAEMNATFDPIYELPGPPQPWVEAVAGEAFKSPHSRQKWRMNQRNSSVPSITVSEPEEKDEKIARPYQHVLAELPGSTPDDLQRYSQEPDPRSHSVGEAAFSLSQCATSPKSVDPDERTMVASSQIASKPATPPPRPPRPRRSFDQVRPSISTFEDRARASFDMTRPRAYSEQVRTQRSVEVRNRASHDLVQPMPTLAERPIERFNSTASVAVGDAVSIPIAAMRHRSKPVTVRKPPAKHRSLPNELPSFPSQSSLMDDLSTWVIPQSARESYRSIQSIQSEKTESISTSTPATSATSSPIVSNTSANWPPLAIDASMSGAVSISDSTGISDHEEASLRSSPVSVKTSPAIPSRPAPPPPVAKAAPPPPRPPKIPLNQPPPPEATTTTILYENLFRSDSAPIPPPLSRRRKPVRPPTKPKSQEESHESIPVVTAKPPPTSAVDVATPTPAIDSAATTPTPSQGRVTSSQPQQSEPEPNGPAPSKTSPMESLPTQAAATVPESIHSPPAEPPPSQSAATFPPPTSTPPSPVTRNALHHLTSSASATDKYPIPYSPSTAPPVPSLPLSLPLHSPPIQPYQPTESQSNIHPLTSNASATDKYPIALSTTLSPPISKDASQTSLSAVSSVETLATVSDAPAAQPLTAIAKRRAAHRRRMQMAFAEE